jgi:hypothetical protein
VIKRVLALLGVVAAFASAIVSLSADIGPPADIASRARGAGRIVVARVIDVRSQFSTNRFGDQLIVSTAVLEVAETLKGGPASTLEVEVEGGTVGDLTLKVSDLPSLAPGDRAVFFLDAGTGRAMTPHDRGRGILRLSQGDRVENSSVTLASLRDQVRAALRGAR